MSAPELWDLEERSGVFQEVSAVAPGNSAVGGGERTVRAEALITSPDYFELLGAKPELGRVYTRQDSVPGFLEPVVISDGFWRRNYGSDPKIIGRKMSLDRDLYTIVGVMPPGFRHPGRTLDTDVEVWLATGFNGRRFLSRRIGRCDCIPAAIGRLKPGMTVAQAQSQLDAYVAQLSARISRRSIPPLRSGAVRLVSVQEDLVGPQRTELFILFGAVGFLLLIACVNIANLLLARASGRRREIAIRLAMGASRARLARQLLTESTLLAVISGVVALVTVLFLKNAIVSMAPADIPRLNEVDVERQGAFFCVRDFDMHGRVVRAGACAAGFQSQSGGESARRRARLGSEQTTLATFADSGGFRGGAFDYFAGGRRATAAKFLARAAGASWIQSQPSDDHADLDSAAE